jgi:hypothetical protein
VAKQDEINKANRSCAVESGDHFKNGANTKDFTISANNLNKIMGSVILVIPNKNYQKTHQKKYFGGAIIWIIIGIIIYKRWKNKSRK